MERELVAILKADVAGYSRMMQADEVFTVRTLTEFRQAMAGMVAVRRGQVVHTAGDSFLAKFPSVADAVECALEVQDEIGARNAQFPEDRQVRFRIGLNLGDVIHEGGDIYGDGVNIAARIEALAVPGGICVSARIYDQTRYKAGLSYEDLGEHAVKNIAAPVRAFRLRAQASPEPALAKVAAAVDRAGGGLSLPDRPSIAVLPFTNMSGDPEQEFFGDGITEDIITELSRSKELFAIARNSTFVYKGRAVNVQDVAKELGVQYVVEGSERKVGERVRISVQLIDPESNSHLWAERYDRQLEDIFAIQDEVTQAIVATLPGRLEEATRNRVTRKTPENMAAYECALVGKVLHHLSTRDDNAEALRMLDRAIELDPSYGHAHAWRACVLAQSWVYGWCDDRDALWADVIEGLKTALALDDDDADVHRILAAVELASGDHDKSVHHQERALSLNPNYDLVVVQQGELLTWLGQPQEGIEWIRKAMRLNPYHPQRFWNHLGRAHFVARQYSDAIDAFNHLSAPDHTHQAFLAACAAIEGDEAAARTHADDVLKQEPGFTVSDYLSTLHYKHASDREHHRDGLVKAGLPE